MLDYLYFALLMLVGQLSPGPDMLVILKNSFNHNLRAALFTIAGITAGIIVHTSIALAGLTFLMSEGSTLYTIFKYAGAAYLAYLGIQLLLSLKKKTSTDPESAEKATQLPDGKAFLQGLLTNLLNPKIVIIISSVLLMFLDEKSTTTQRLTYGGILVIEGIVVWILFALLLQTQHAKRQFLRWQHPINATFGLLLIALAIRAVL